MSYNCTASKWPVQTSGQLGTKETIYMPVGRHLEVRCELPLKVAADEMPPNMMYGTHKLV